MCKARKHEDVRPYILISSNAEIKKVGSGFQCALLNLIFLTVLRIREVISLLLQEIFWITTNNCVHFFFQILNIPVYDILYFKLFEGNQTVSFFIRYLECSWFKEFLVLLFLLVNVFWVIGFSVEMVTFVTNKFALFAFPYLQL